MATIGKAEFRRRLTEMVAETLNDDTVEVAFDTDPDNGNLIIAVAGLTINDDGDIATVRREFDWTATVTLTFSGTVTAASEEAGEEAVEDWLNNDLPVNVDMGSNGDLSLDDWCIDTMSVDSVY